MNKSILWYGIEIQKCTPSSALGEVPFLCYTTEYNSNPVIVAFHSADSSKEIWLHFDNPSISGNLLKQSICKDFCFLAMDLPGSGEWPEGTKVNPEESAAVVTEALESLLKDQKLDKNDLIFIGDKEGAEIALRVSQKIPPKRMLLLSPDIHEELVPKLPDTKIMTIAGNNDKTCSVDELKEYIQKIPALSKKMLIYECGHTLPYKWMEDSGNFIFRRAETLQI